MGKAELVSKLTLVDILQQNTQIYCKKNKKNKKQPLFIPILFNLN